MRIGILSTPHVPTPPRGYGASELIAGQIVEGLLRRGHEVRLFAGPDSTEAGDLRTYPSSRIGKTFEQRELIHVASAFADLDGCDLVHNHCVTAGPPFAKICPVPFLTTLHYHNPVLDAFPDGNYVAVSNNQRERLLRQPHPLNVVASIPNGVDLRDFPLSQSRGDYLLFLGRFHPNKGADLAIEVAQRLGRRLILAAPSPPPDQQEWFDRFIAPKLGGRIEWIGSVEGIFKASLLGGAAATLVPLRWDEPFGLVMVESMACGTPPVAIRRGAAPEIIEDGINGFLVDDAGGMDLAVERASQIAPELCRRRVEACFTTSQMVDGYVALYESYVMTASARRTNTKLGT
jgi:glycosyltransferase involved in cell wall biosynthesis